MDKALDMGQTSAVGSLQLFLGRSISTIILAVGTIILGIFISQSDYGLYTVALVPASTFLLFQDWGMSNALVRFIAKNKAVNDYAEQRNTMVAGLIFEVITGVILTIVCVLFANFIGSTVFGRPESVFLIVITSITIISTAVGTGATNIFVGLERMKLVSYATFVQAIVYTSTVPALVYFGYGALGAVIGFTLSTIASAIAQLFFLYFLIFKKLPESVGYKLEISRTMKYMLKFGIPLSIGGVVSGLSGPVYSFLMAAYVGNALIGNYKIATNFTVLLSFLTLPISTVLFPAFSKIDPKNEKNLLKTIFNSSVKYTVLLVVPATMAMIVLSNPLIGTIYGNKWAEAPLFLSATIVFKLLTLFGWNSMTSFFPAVGETKLVMNLNLVSLGISIASAFILVPPLGILGIIIGAQISVLPLTVLGLYFLWKRYGLMVDFRSSAKIFLASSIATVAAYLFILIFHVANWILLAAGATLFLAIYLISAPVIGAISQFDLVNLRTMFSGLGIVSKLLGIFLTIMERAIKITHLQLKAKKPTPDISG